jgi:tetratricopeptide (TPR) repeat protein
MQTHSAFRGNGPRNAAAHVGFSMAGVGRWCLGIALLLPFPAAAEPGEEAAAPSGAAADTTPAALAYEQEAQMLEAEYGPFDPRLGEQLLGLGLVYKRQQRYDDAARALDRALHIRRINEGLHSLGQQPVLEALIEANIAAESWDALDRNYQHLLWIHRRNYDDTDPRLLPITQTVGQWKLTAHARRLLKQPLQLTLREADQLYSGTVRILEKQYGKTDPILIEPLYGKAMVNYQLLIEVRRNPPPSARVAADMEPAVRYTQVCTPTRDGRVICRQIAIPNISRFERQAQAQEMVEFSHINSIESALKQIVSIHEAHPELEVRSRAEGLVQLADWNMLKHRTGTAMTYYRRAWDVLAASGAEQQVFDEFFGKPRTIPAMRPLLPEVEQQLAGGAAGHITVAYDVTRRGRAGKINVIEPADAEHQGAQRELTRRLREQVFRPRFENGEPVDTAGVELRVPVR